MSVKTSVLLVVVIVAIIAVALGFYFASTQPQTTTSSISPTVTKTTTQATTTSTTTSAVTSSTTAPPAEKTLVLAWTSDVHTLNPGMAIDTASDEIILNIYDTLVDYKLKEVDKGAYKAIVGEFAPALAESWEISEDGRTYTFHLRKDAKFHNGDLVTSHAVKYTLDALAKWGWLYSNIDSVEAPDDYTVVVHLKKADPLFLHYLWLYSAGIVNPKLVEAHGGYTSDNKWLTSNDAGSGPYKLVSWKPGEEIVLEAVKDHWRKPKIDKVVIKIVKDPSVVEMMLKTGEIHGPATVPDKDINMMMKEPNLKYLVFDSYCDVFYVILNCQQYPLNVTKVRQALAWATPTDQIIKLVTYGWAEPAKSIVPKNTFGHDPSPWVYSYNITKAKELLKEAGFEKGVNLVAYIPPSWTTYVQILTILQDAWKKAGVNLEIRKVEDSTYWDMLWKGQIPVTIMDWPSFVADPGYHLMFLVHSKSIGPNGNWAFYNNSKVDKLVSDAYNASDPGVKAKLLSDVQKILAEDVPYIPLYYPKYVFFMNKKLTGYAFYPDTLTRYWLLDIEGG